MTHISKLKVALIVALCTLISTTTLLYAFSPLVVSVPLMGTTGQNSAIPCDTDGVSTSFTYGANRPSGVKVASVSVSGVNVLCHAVTVFFLDSAGAEVAAYAGINSTGNVPISTNIWTDQFTDVRVTLMP